MTVPALPDDALYFHAQYRQSAPCVPVTRHGPKLNPDGAKNYVYMETRGRGHLMGVTLGVLQNANGWWGEGDDMIFVDDEVEAGDHRDRVAKIISWAAGISAAATAPCRSRTRMYGAPLIVDAGAHGRPVLLLSLARRQSGDVRAVPEAHDGARPRQRSRRQLLLGRLLVSGDAVHGFPAAARAWRRGSRR